MITSFALWMIPMCVTRSSFFASARSIISSVSAMRSASHRITWIQRIFTHTTLRLIKKQKRHRKVIFAVSFAIHLKIKVPLRAQHKEAQGFLPHFGSCICQGRYLRRLQDLHPFLSQPSHPYPRSSNHSGVWSL